MLLKNLSRATGRETPPFSSIQKRKDAGERGYMRRVILPRFILINQCRSYSFGEGQFGEEKHSRTMIACEDRGWAVVRAEIVLVVSATDRPEIIL